VKRSLIVLAVLAGTAACAQPATQEAAPEAQTPAPAARGRGPSPEQQAAMAAQDQLEKNTPQLQIREEVLQLDIPGHTIGEAVGVATNSQGHLFVFTRSGGGGPAKASTASQLFEFDQNYRFIKQWGPDNYAAAFAHTVRVDKYDNVWMTDEGANMIVKFTPQARVAMVLGRKEEAIDYFERFIEEKQTLPEPGDGSGNPGTYGRPTDVAFDSQDNIYISDGYNNARVAKVAKDGTWVKSVGTRGSGPDQFNTVHGITSDANDNIYVADRGNRRIKVFDTDLNLKKTFTNVGAPWSLCVSPGSPQYLFSGDGNGKIYKLDTDGNLLGWAQSSMGHGQTGCLVHELSCVSSTVILKGDCSTWTVEKITITGGGKSMN
jgi:DNA-binding beta-propeller fold protein YncE